MGKRSQVTPIAGALSPVPGAWPELVDRAVALVGTPCFVVSAAGVRAALDELVSSTPSTPVRPWLSLKTQPVKRLLELWRDWGHGVEVVSRFELAAAIRTGLPPNRILVNGTGKQRWLRTAELDGLNVHFDSIAEVQELKELASACNWNVGLRHQVMAGAHESDQFGMTPGEIASAAQLLRTVDLRVRGAHFHIRSNVSSVREFAAALRQVRGACSAAGIEPDYVDIGGGLPVSGECPADGSIPSWSTFDLREWRSWLATIPDSFPQARELWLENGRFMTARAGALVVTVVDRKDRADATYLICDGGRTNHARMSAVEVHEVLVRPERGGPRQPTVVCGPTCGSVDRLGYFSLPASLQIGDRLLWLNAGAYAIPLETRFSFGLAPVVWFDTEGNASVARPRETAEQWWSQWA